MKDLLLKLMGKKDFRQLKILVLGDNQTHQNSVEFGEEIELTKKLDHILLIILIQDKMLIFNLEINLTNQEMMNHGVLEILEYMLEFVEHHYAKLHHKNSLIRSLGMKPLMDGQILKEEPM